MIKSRLAAALVMTTIAWLAVVSGASAETLISPTTAGGSHSCNPVAGDPYLHRCETLHYGLPGRLGIDLVVGSASGGTAPTAYDVEGLATMSNTATHQLTAPAPQVTYSWKFTAQDTGFEPTQVEMVHEPQGTPTTNYVALQVSADHATCITCTAVNRAVLVGEDPDAGQSGPSQLPNGTVVEVTTTLTNSAGGNVPAGTVTVQADLQGHSDWTADPTFQGLAHVESGLQHQSLTASTGEPPPPLDEVQVDAGDAIPDEAGANLVCGEASNPCDTIQRGIARASAGGTVQVAEGAYREQVEIGKDLTLDGAGEGTVIESPDEADLQDEFDAGLDRRPVVLAHDANVTVSDLKVDGRRQGSPDCDFAFFGIAYHNAGGTVRNATVTGTRSDPRADCYTEAIANLNDAEVQRSWTVDGSTVSDFGSDGIGAGNDASVSEGLTDVVFSNNTVLGAGNIAEGSQFGITVGNYVEANIFRNTVRELRCDADYCGADPLANFSSMGIALFFSESGSHVLDNTVEGNDIGVYNWTPDATTLIADNTLSDNRYQGVYLDEGNANLDRNLISGGDTGVAVVSFADFAFVDSHGSLTGNTITGAETGVKLVDEDESDSVNPDLGASSNRIAGNSGAGIANTTTASQVRAENNWWGCNAGPGQPGCDSTIGPVDSNPRLVLEVSASPSTIPTGGASSTVTASLTRNSNGATPVNRLRNGTTIQFSTDLGSVSPTQAGMTNASAATTLTSGATPGTAHPSATLDGQTATTNVVIEAPVNDTDGDGAPDSTDNCPAVANPDQANRDGDAQGDACDPDDDNDSLADGADGCPIGETGWTSTTQADRDADGCRDATEDADDDNDTVADSGDNCPTTSNQAQTNSDTDSLGDACDPDDDNDTVVDASDNCDLQPGPSSNAGCPEPEPQDQDGDGRSDSSDNCPAVANPSQANRDGDAQGDACDPDDDNDSVADGADGCPSGETGWTSTTAADADADGCRDASEDADDDNDTVADSGDNCRTASNQAQTNSDSDSLGDACDPDDDNDGFADATDACPIVVGTAPSGCPFPPPPIAPAQAQAPPPSATSPSPTSKPVKKCKKKAGKKCKKKK